MHFTYIQKSILMQNKTFENLIQTIQHSPRENLVTNCVSNMIIFSK